MHIIFKKFNYIVQKALATQLIIRTYNYFEYIFSLRSLYILIILNIYFGCRMRIFISDTTYFIT
jgi:hypothetical protein